MAGTARPTIIRDVTRTQIQLMTVENELQSFIAGLEQDRSLDEPHQLRQRIEALDRLDSYIAQWSSVLPGKESTPAALHHRAERLCSRLEAINFRVYETIRRDIQAGAGRNSLREWASRCQAAELANGKGYDPLDELIGGVFLPGGPSAERIRLEPEMVPYQPTPARQIFDLVERMNLDAQDVFIDLGSGLGQVCLVVAACTGAPCVGIEVEPAYVDHARDSAKALHLDNATFLEGDARSADLSGGTVFYLYTPFTGAMLRNVLDSLRQHAASRPIRICTYGPCTGLVAGEPWLSAIGTEDPRQVVIFRSRN